jgi:hypothetical protein
MLVSAMTDNLTFEPPKRAEHDSSLYSEWTEMLAPYKAEATQASDISVHESGSNVEEQMALMKERFEVGQRDREELESKAYRIVFNDAVRTDSISQPTRRARPKPRGQRDRGR